jgi:hypothetical protein
MYTQEQYRAKLAEIEAERAKEPPITANSLEQARNRWLTARDKVTELETQVQPLGYVRPQYRAYYERLHGELAAAKEEMRDAKEAFDKMNSKVMAHTLAARAKSQAMKAEREKKQKAEQEARAEQEERDTKKEFRTRYLTAGGTEAQFEKAWPAMWANELERRTLEGKDRTRERLLASGRYVF